MTSPIAYTEPNKGVQLEPPNAGVLQHLSPLVLMHMAQRPRQSILSLFDPLSSNIDNSYSPDKENNAGETSFFHPSGRKPPTPMHIMRRRLIDVGDITVDDPSIQDLLEEEEELEQLHNIEEEDDGNTLTWKDMAKAATPKWSNRHTTAFATPKSSPTPRTPLAELSFKDEATPIARKKPYRRQIIPATSKPAQDIPTCTIEILPPSPAKTMDSPRASSSSTFSTSNEGSDDNMKVDIQLNPEGSGVSLGSSVCTLNLPSATGALIADTSLPLSTSPSSESSLSPNAPSGHSPAAQARLRPTLDPRNADNRHSVDLHSSFQMHMSASDATFDLLNEKISFFSSKDGMDSFLHGLEIDTSFGDDDFGSVASGTTKETKSTSPPRESSAIIKPVASIMEENPTRSYKTKSHSASPPPEAKRLHVSDLPLKPLAAVTDTEADTAVCPTNAPHDAGITGYRATKSGHSSPRSSFDSKNANALSTPSSSRSNLDNPPPPPVPGLRIVKRAKTLTRRPSTVSNASTTSTISSRRTSSVPTEIIPTSRSKSIPAVPSLPGVNGNQYVDPALSLPSKAAKRTTVPSYPTVQLSGDGPRRVLISEGPKLSSVTNSRATAYLEQAKTSAATSGPRRVPVAPTVSVVEKPVVQASTGLKQPAKFATVGSSSAIPKPVARLPGSRLPAPPAPRFGVTVSAPGKGLLARRVT